MSVRENAINFYSVFTYEMFTYEIFTYEMFSHEMFTCEMFAYEMVTYEMFTCTLHCTNFISDQQVKSFISDRRFNSPLWCSHICDVHLSVSNVHFCFVHSALSSAAALMFKSPLSPFLVKVYLLLCPPSNPGSNCANFQAVCYVTESSISVTQCQSVDKYILKKWQIDVLQFGEIHLAIWRNTFSDLEKYILRFWQICCR